MSEVAAAAPPMRNAVPPTAAQVAALENTWRDPPGLVGWLMAVNHKAIAGDNKLLSQPSTEPEPLLPAPSPRTIVSCSARILAVIAPSASCSGESAFIAFIMPSRPGGL